MKSVIIFLCTPRCGTQWFVKNLNKFCGNEVKVLHEPLYSEYLLKENLGRYNSAELKINHKLNNHFASINEVTQNKSYIEVGWPTISVIPEFYKKFGERLKLIHLYRNPVKVGASLVTHNWYTGKIEDRSENLELNPFDIASILDEYQSRWNEMSLFEKNLYFWTEINLRALEIKHRYPRIPFYSLKFENLFKGNKELSRITLVEILAFMDLNYNDKMLEALDIKQDKYHYKSTVKMDWKKIYEHPQAMALANKLGYTFDSEIDLSRYKRMPYKRVIGKMKSLIIYMADEVLKIPFT